MVACKECGTDLPMPGVKWYVGSGQRKICSTCRADESQWPRNVTADAVRNYPWVQDAASGRNDTNRPSPHPRCGHQCANIGPLEYLQYSTGCCACARRSHQCSVCYPRRISSALMGNGAPRHHADQIQKEILTDLYGNQFQVSSETAHDRRSRLHANYKILYHQTSPQAASAIMASQRMLRGSEGLAGGGIYFAESPRETFGKAHEHGVILSCKVLLGRVRTIPSSGDRYVNFGSLLESGYDSVLIPRPGGTEYVVYNSDQVPSIRVCR